MTSKGTSIFAQMVTAIERPEFNRIVGKYQGDKSAKGLTCWDQFVSMLFCHLGKAQSLREISGGLATSTGKLSHLGVRHVPPRSTLSYANSHRDYRIYEELFYVLLDRCQATGIGKKKFRFKSKLFSLDATVIDLCLSMFPWAEFRQTKGAVKMHVLLDHDGYLPTFVHISDGLTHEVTAAREVLLRDFHVPEGSFIVFDRGYTDYDFFAHWCQSNVWFVTRQKNNAKYEVVETYDGAGKKNILKDERIRLTGFYSQQDCPFDLRRIEVWDEINNVVIILLTNNFALSAVTIAAIYKDRWQIEIFFKTIKQHLKIKTFIGTTANALKIQIWTALITILLLKYFKARSTYNWSLSNLVAMLRFNLFTYRDLQAWLDNPFESPPEYPDDGQLAFEGFLGQQKGAYSRA